MIAYFAAVVKYNLVRKDFRATRKFCAGSYVRYAPINVTPHPSPCGLTYFYRGFDSEYRPNLGDIDIFSNSPL